MARIAIGAWTRRRRKTAFRVLRSTTQVAKTQFNMQDYAASATLPAPRKPSSWSDIQDAVNGLVTFCNMYSDSTTRRLAATLAGFVSAMQSYDNWPKSRLNVLVYWINERLFAYRGLVDQHIHERSCDPAVALAWFAPSNPDLAPLRSTVFQLDMAALQASAWPTSVHSSLPQPARPSRTHAQPSSSSAARSGIPPNVSGAIPRRGGNELCLKFASAGACNTSGQTCTFNGRVRGHFIDRSMPRAVRQYIVSRLGGLSSDYAESE